MALTPNQKSFAQACATGVTGSKALRASTFKTDKMSTQTIANNAYKLLQNGEIVARIDELKKELAEKGLWSREDSIRAMIEVIHSPDNQGCKISAVKVINEMQGFNAPVKSEHSGTVIVATKYDEDL